MIKWQQVSVGISSRTRSITVNRDITADIAPLGVTGPAPGIIGNIFPAIMTV
jgi:hypothetical protein